MKLELGAGIHAVLLTGLTLLRLWRKTIRFAGHDWKGEKGERTWPHLRGCHPSYRSRRPPGSASSAHSESAL